MEGTPVAEAHSSPSVSHMTVYFLYCRLLTVYCVQLRQRALRPAEAPLLTAQCKNC